MRLIYDFFKGKENITDDDIEDFEAHAEMMQDRALVEMDRKRYGGKKWLKTKQKN